VPAFFKSGGDVAGKREREVSVSGMSFERLPLIQRNENARAWLKIQGDLGLARNTLEAYARAIEEYLRFSQQCKVTPDQALRDHIAAYVCNLTSRTRTHTGKIQSTGCGTGLANPTIHQRLIAVRLYYDYLVEEGIRNSNSVGRGRYRAERGFRGGRERGLVPHHRTLPWIPNDDEWRAVIEAARQEPIRNRVMSAFSYDAALRREELCGLDVADIDPSYRLIRVRSETTKNHHERVVPYSEATGKLYSGYLQRRRELTRERGRLFISESLRNRGKPVSIWTWSKVILRIAERSQIRRFTTHSPRHLCLTDLARADWDIHEIALFAGHRSIQTTLLYIHLSGRKLASKLERGMAEIHAWRSRVMKERLE
jgi:integrase/recombinase XerD